MTMSKKWGMLFLAKKKTAGWLHSKTEVVTTSRHTPNPTGTKLYIKINISICPCILIENDLETNLYNIYIYI